MADENPNRFPDQEPSTKKIYETWRTQWIADTSQRSAAEGGDYNSLFLSLYESAYAKSVQKMENNNWWNNCSKRLFAYIVFFGAAVQVVLCITAVKVFLGNQTPGIQGKTVGDIVALDALLLLTVIALLLSVSKWISIKKYQETWARHTYTISLYQQAMLLYLQGQPMDALPFPGLEEVSFPTSLDKQQAFQLRILQIMEKNQQKFTLNIAEKEIHLMEDVVSLLK